MDERTDASAAFALRLAVDLLSGLVLRGIISKADAAALLDDSVASALASHAQHEPEIRQIAATATAQVELAWADLNNRLSRSSGYEPPS